ncbi:MULTISPECIES: amino acid adenylation domain-containing protein [Methylosinus]|uniref:Thioester reductase n=1 Tax=Methylosinus trichosporium (strain ATCC 35070 / NCIMB 11131 / UNIQEM 75 / OB3b) TaxID=595536 RepID=A0A2D2D619_METT3|nr:MULTISPECIES: amino acid adenylation domain-containing protein [Methylosinus]ATQ70289.1 thioester reductase [Methylosinus trichosporium OB3b]
MNLGADADVVSVVFDENGHGALWPAGMPIPQGWRAAAPACDRAAALAFLERVSPPCERRGAPLADRSIPGRLAALASDGPDRAAIYFDDRVVTRGELDRLAARIAAALTDAGAGAETIVAVALGRSPEAIAAFLGVMRAGAAFLPIDPAYPQEAIAFRLDDSGAHALVTDAAHRERLPPTDGLTMITLDWLPAGAARAPDTLEADRLAYVIYTSGSTGRPKGVAVEHGPLAMHIETTAQAYEMSERSRELHFLSFAFDGAHERWMTPLFVGGSIVLRGDALWTPAETLIAIRAGGVTHAGFPTSYMAALAAWAETMGDPPAVQCYSFGGEAMARATFERTGRALRPRFLINGYGPTETVISPLIWKVEANVGFDEPYAPIGGPVGDRTAHILATDLSPVADGETGELWIGGSGLARGYLNRPASTAQRFLPDPYAKTCGRMYRTGDLARRRPDGAIAFVGREDGQVKIRGFRVELGEIEARLREEPTVAEAVVVRREGRAGPTLAAYVTPRPGRTPEPGRLRARLAGALPAPLVPSRIMALERLPLLPNGKVDRASLPEPGAVGPPPRAPSTETERRVAALWGAVLDLPEVGVDSPFFDLGGDSLSALRLLARLRLAFPGRRLGVADLLGDPTVATLAERLDSGVNGDDGPARIIHLRKGGGQPPLVLFPGLLVSLREYEPLVRRLPSDQPAFGFACASLTEEPEPLPEIDSLAQSYADAIECEVGGRGCAMLGWSWGGVLAYETARRLIGRVRVHFIAMADVCALEPPFAQGSTPPLEADERGRHRERIDAWLVGSPMRARWETLRARMDAETEDCFLRFLSTEPQPLPVDGPLVGSRERVLHTLIDHALQMRALTLQPLDVIIFSFQAERSIAEHKPIIDWRELASQAHVDVAASTDHFDIVLSRSLHERIAELLGHMKGITRRSNFFEVGRSHRLHSTRAP